MTEIMPYFAGFITLLFAVGFLFALREMKKQKMKRKRILCLFDYVARTGFSTVSTNIVREIKKNFGAEIHLDIVAINYFGEAYWEDANTYIIPAKITDDKKDDYGRYLCLKILKESNDYDGLFICQDLGVIVPFIEVVAFLKKEKKEQNQKGFKSIFYFPVDCVIVEELTKNLEFFDLLVTYTEFGRKEILKHRPELKSKLRVVPHGNNSKDFYPIEREAALSFRNEYFGENSEKFIITNVNRNQPRKDLPNTIFGFIEAKKMWDKALPMPFLYLHCHPQDPMGWDIRGIMIQTDLVEDIDYKLLPKEFEKEMCDIETLNKIYNASDVFITTTLGEGWGCTYGESAACKLPVIAPFVTSFMEMSGYGKNAYMLETIYPYCSPTDNIVREQTDIYEIGETILQVAKEKAGNSEKLTKKIQDNYEWVSKLEWKYVCKSWISYFKEIFF